MSILTKPYPKSTHHKRKLLYALSLGLFVFLFLLLFQPFGINMWHPSYKVYRLMGYGLITSLTLIINSMLIESVFKSWFKEEIWTVWKEILWTLWTVLLIGTLNLLYSNWQQMFNLNWANFLTFQWITLLIGMFPVVTATLINYSRLQNKNLAEAQTISKVIDSDHNKQSVQDNQLVLVAENGRDQITIKESDLYMMVSADNYVEVYYCLNGHMHKELLRNTIKNLEKSLKMESSLFRCHRSYLVNLKKVVHVSGNSQGYKLHFDKVEFFVPVSRSLNETIRQKISEIHTIHPG
jgi:K+ transporter